MKKVSANLVFFSPSGLCKGFTQGGSNADNVLADAFAKINHSDIDWSLAYEAVVKDAEVEPYGVSKVRPLNVMHTLTSSRLVL